MHHFEMFLTHFYLNDNVVWGENSIVITVKNVHQDVVEIPNDNVPILVGVDGQRDVAWNHHV